MHRVPQHLWPLEQHSSGSGAGVRQLSRLHRGQSETTASSLVMQPAPQQTGVVAGQHSPSGGGSPQPGRLHCMQRVYSACAFVMQLLPQQTGLSTGQHSSDGGGSTQAGRLHTRHSDTVACASVMQPLPQQTGLSAGQHSSGGGGGDASQPHVPSSHVWTNRTSSSTQPSPQQYVPLGQQSLGLVGAHGHSPSHAILTGLMPQLPATQLLEYVLPSTPQTCASAAL